MTNLLLVRHAQSEWNANGRWQGHADPPLSPLGGKQARAAAERVGTVDAIFASDLVRAAATAEIIAGPLGMAIEVDARLRERSAGPWEGLTRAEIEEGWPGFLASGERPLGYEDDDSVLVRATGAVLAIASALPGAEVLVVTHGGVVRALERALGAGDDRGLVANLAGVEVAVASGILTLGARVALLDGAVATTPEQI